MNGRWVLFVLLGFVGACSSVSPEQAGLTTIPSGMVTAAASVTVSSSTVPTSAPLPTSSGGPVETQPEVVSVVTGAGVLARDDFQDYAGLAVGLIVNQTSIVGANHLIDLVAQAEQLELVAIFAPEHGVRGVADAGELVDDTVDTKTGTPIFSLFGATRQPTPTMLQGLDVLFYDLQDVGARHYTYISTMGLAMQSAAAAGIPFVVLDRPNPLGGERVEGPVREQDQDSFIGQYPIPSVYGLTAGELALAIKGERWLPDLEGLDLRVVEIENWERNMLWPDTGLVWVAPSPGLPTFESALLYPGTVLLEATTVSYGNGTLEPFTMVGAPWLEADQLVDGLRAAGLRGVDFESTSYVPTVIPEMAPNPRFEGDEIVGASMVVTDQVLISPFRMGVVLIAKLLSEADRLGQGTVVDRSQVFDLLTGSAQIRRDLLDGVPPSDIVDALKPGIAAFRALRDPYLLY